MIAVRRSASRRRSRSGGRWAAREKAEQIGVKAGRGEVDVDPGGVAPTTRIPILERAPSEVCEPGPGDRQPARHGIGERKHQPVRHRTIDDMMVRALAERTRQSDLNSASGLPMRTGAGNGRGIRTRGTTGGPFTSSGSNGVGKLLSSE